MTARHGRCFSWQIEKGTLYDQFRWSFHCLFLPLQCEEEKTAKCQPVCGTVLACKSDLRDLSLSLFCCLVFVFVFVFVCCEEKTASQAAEQFLPSMQVWSEGQDLFQQADHEKTKLHKKSNFLTRDKQRQPHLRTKTNKTHSNFQCLFFWGTGHVPALWPETTWLCTMSIFENGKDNNAIANVYIYISVSSMLHKSLI